MSDYNFSEIEQEEIINKFLDDININETEKIIKKEIAKHNYNPIELFHLNLPNNALKLINDYGKEKCKCEKCSEYNYLINYQSVTTYQNQWQGRKRKLYHHKANWYFSKLYNFPDEETLKRQFKISKKKHHSLWFYFTYCIDAYDELEKGVYEHLSKCITHYSKNKTIDELNKIMKFMYENNYNKYDNIKLNYYPQIKLT